MHEHPVIVMDSISKCQTPIGAGKTISIEVGSPCPSLKQLKNSYNKLKESCIFHSSRDYWDTDSEWLSCVEDTGYLVIVFLITMLSLRLKTC